MFCYKCGKKIDDDAKFCCFCGAETNKSSAEGSTEHVPEVKNVEERPAMRAVKKKVSTGWIFGLAGIVVLIVALVSILGGHQKVPSAIDPEKDEIVNQTALPTEENAGPASNVVIFDQDDLYVEFRGIDEYSSKSWIVNLYVENNRDSEIYLSLRDGLINKYSIGFSNNGITIPAGSKYLAASNFDLIIDLEDLEKYDITTLESLDFNLRVSTSMFGDEICETPVALQINKPLQ